MKTTIATQITPQGLLVPRSALGEWLERGVEAVKEEERIIIRPRSAEPDCWSSRIGSLPLRPFRIQNSKS